MCMKALGIEDGTVPDDSITASSYLNGDSSPKMARLNSEGKKF